jgi:hypothetical protein
MKARVLLLTGALLLAATSSAHAAAPPQTAYWWQGQAAQAPAPPTVPAGGLYVASTAAGPTAESAVRFTLSSGAEARTLSLKVHQLQQVDGVAITAYPTAVAWKAGDNQPWAARPDHLPAPAFPGTLGLDGVTFSFDLSAAHLTGTVDLVLAAAAAPSAPDSAVITAPTFDATFDRPATGALSETPQPAATQDPTAAPTSLPSPAPFLPPAPQHVGALGPAVPVAPAVGPVVATPAPVIGFTAAPATPQLTTAARSASAGRGAHTTLALALLLGLVTFYLGWRTREAVLTSSPRTSIYELPPEQPASDD